MHVTSCFLQNQILSITTAKQQLLSFYSLQMVVLQSLMWIPAAEQAWTYEETAAHMQSSLCSQLQLSYMQLCKERRGEGHINKGTVV